MLRALLIALVGSLIAAVLVGDVGAAVLVGDVGAADGARAAAETGRAAAKTGAEAEAELILAPQDPLMQPGAAEYVFTVLLRNPGETALPKGALRLRLDTARIGDTSGLVEWESGEGDPTGIVVAETPAEETRPGEEQTLTLTVPQARMPLGFGSQSGVYGVAAELHSTDTEGAPVADGGTTPPGDSTSTMLLSGSSTVVWRTARWTARLPLTVVVPFVLPAEVEGMPSPSQLAEAVPRLSTLLDAAERWRATLAIDPRIVAGIRGYGDAAPAPARDLLERLSSAPVPSFLLQFADADPSAQASLGYKELLAPTGLSYITSQGSFPPPTTEPGSAGAAGDAGTDPDAAPTPPDLDELLDWPTGRAAAWPAPGAVDAKTLRLLERSGLDSLVLRSDNVIGNRSARATVGAFDALVSDAALDEAAAGALSGGTESERAASTAELAARLALDAEERSSGIALALDRAAVADAETPAAIFDTLDRLGWVLPTAAAAQPTGSARLNPGSTTKDRRELLRENAERAQRIDALAPLLEKPWHLTEYQRVRLLGAFATRYAQPGIDLARLAKQLREHDDTLLEGVRAVPSDNTQLIGASSRVPVLVHNALPFDALVTLKVAPSSAAIVVPERRFEGQRIAPGGNSTVLVPVDSRVSSGDAMLTVRIADSVDEAVFSQAPLRLTIRSSYEAIMLTVLGGLAALLLGFGVWRSVRRHRPGASTGTAD